MAPQSSARLSRPRAPGSRGVASGMSVDLEELSAVRHALRPRQPGAPNPVESRRDGCADRGPGRPGEALTQTKPNPPPRPPPEGGTPHRRTCSATDVRRGVSPHPLSLAPHSGPGADLRQRLPERAPRVLRGLPLEDHGPEAGARVAGLVLAEQVGLGGAEALVQLVEQGVLLVLDGGFACGTGRRDWALKGREGQTRGAPGGGGGGQGRRR